MKYIYIVAGRKFWFDLACELNSHHGHSPVLLLGDAAYVDSFKKKFKECRTADNKDHALKQSGESMQTVLCSPDFHWIKDEAIKMLDRVDAHDLWGRKRREIVFYEKLLCACALIDNARPDFLLLSESPHDILSYLIWRVAKAAGILCIHFEAVSITPALVMATNGNKLEQIPKCQETDSFGASLVAEHAGHFLDRFTAGKSPVYMTNQKSKEAVHHSVLRRLRDTALRTFPLSLALAKEIKCPKQAGGRISKSRLKLWGREKTDALRQAYSGKASSDFWDKKFIYYPLHYEPERTTSPDGGIFYDQIRAVAEIRSRLPTDYTLVIKEHPSQLYKNMRGFKGRAKETYDLLERIEGIKLAPADTPSSNLIEHCRGLATITGTAAIEAVLSGKPVLVLGHAWFRSLSGIYGNSDIDEFLAHAEYRRSQPDHDEIREKLLSFLSDYTFFGCINPSNESLYPNLASDFQNQSARPLADHVAMFIRRNFAHISPQESETKQRSFS